MTERKKLKMLAWCDSPLSITGFGVVAKNILGRTYDTGMFDLACVGINYIEEHHEKMWESRANDVPYKVLIGQDMVRQQNGALIPTDPMGRQKVINLVKNGDCDVLFLMRDMWDMVVPQWEGQPHLSSYFPLHFQLAKESGRNFRILSHFPMEYQVQPNWHPMLDMIDYGYCFTAGGMPQMEKWQKNIKWCPQGADHTIFKPLPKVGWGKALCNTNLGPQWVPIADNKDFRIKKMQLDDPDCFLVLNINRNQPRKDIRASLASFKKFKDIVLHKQGNAGRRPVLWLHMRPDDSFGDARKLVEEEGLIVDYDVKFPPYFNVGVGWTEDELNMLYNATDVFISTSVAEGWGLTPVEAGFSCAPVLVPGHTGHLQTMQHLGMPYIKTTAPEIRRDVSISPIHPTDTQDMAEKLFEHYMKPDVLKQAAKKNHDGFVDKFSWDNIFDRYWLPALKTIDADIRGTAKRQENNKKRFLYVCEEAFGDILGATKAINGLKKENPETPIDFLCKQRFNDVLQKNPDINNILDWDLNKIFDYPKENVFYPHARIRHGGWAGGHTHLMDMQAEMIGIRANTDVKIVPEEFDLMLDEMKERNGLLPIITINTSSQGGKMIELAKWDEIIFYIVNKNPWVRFVCVGGPDDLIPSGAIDMRFEPGEDKVLSYRKMAYLQSKAICHIGIDSGPGHCADAVETPSIIFWGWTNVTTCKPQNYSINIVPHYPTVCPAMGPCHGVSPRCGINQYDKNSSMTAPCIKSIPTQPAIEIINDALALVKDNKDDPFGAAKEELKRRSKKIKKNIYQIPPAPKKVN